MTGKFLALLFQALGRNAFVIEIRQGQARLIAGKAPRAFVAEVTEFAAGEGVAGGIVEGRFRGGRQGVRLNFSKAISERWHQRLRNLWQLYERSGGR